MALKQGANHIRLRQADPRLTPALPDWAYDPPVAPAAKKYVIGLLPGEGIGPEVMAAVIDVLDAVARNSGLTLDIQQGGTIGRKAKAEYGKALPPEVKQWCESVFSSGGAILCGPGGSRFVYDMRSEFDLFCKFTPIKPYPALGDSNVLRPDVLEDVDMVVIRENTSGLYFGDASRRIDCTGTERVTHTFGYSSDEIHRIIEVGIRLAQRRSRRLSLVVKPDGLPAMSDFWIEHFNEQVSGGGLETGILEIDNASYQIIAAASDFDVIVAPNLFGDILSDGAALLLGSRGVSHSGNFGASGVATYQTGHGAAYDICGKDIANPVGQILAAAMMLRESFGLLDVASAIEAAIARTLANGMRTPDIAAPGSTVVGTREMGRRIAEAFEYETSLAFG